MNGYSTYNSKQPKMANAKLLWLICDWLGLPTCVLGFIANLDNVKSVIIAILGMIYLGIRIYYTVIEKRQREREMEYKLWNLEADKQKRAKEENIILPHRRR